MSGNVILEFVFKNGLNIDDWYEIAEIDKIIHNIRELSYDYSLLKLGSLGRVVDGLFIDQHSDHFLYIDDHLFEVDHLFEEAFVGEPFKVNGRVLNAREVAFLNRYWLDHA